MNDYHEFMHAHKVKIKQWQLHWSPNYVSIIGMIMVLINGTLITLNINSTNENGSFNGTT